MKLSIIIPYYETQELTLKLLQQLDKQKNEEVEIILIDDYGNGDIFKNLVNIYIKNENNIGGAASRNKGVKIANGDFIIFIDCDDYIYDNYIEILLNKIQEDNDLTWISWNSIYGNAIVKSIDQPNIAPWGCLFKKNIIKNILFNERKNIGEEPEFWNEIFKNRNLKIGYTSNIIYYYNIREDSATRKYDRGELPAFRW